VQNVSLSTQRHVVTTLGGLFDTIVREQLGSPSIMVVGDVVQGIQAATQGARAHAA
jgi:uroporphyrin-III C-methyltransferase